MTNENGETPLHIAAAQGRDSTCQALVALGVPIDSQDNDGDTPLIAAAQKDQLTTITALLVLGADKTIKNGEGKGLLFIFMSNE